jgi:hypothetical protein
MGTRIILQNRCNHPMKAYDERWQLLCKQLEEKLISLSSGFMSIDDGLVVFGAASWGGEGEADLEQSHAGDGGVFQGDGSGERDQHG